MTRDLSFRIATPTDASIIARIGAETFTAAFSSTNSPSDMQEYLAANFTPDRIQSLLQSPTSTFLLAQQGEKTIGYAMLRAGPQPESVVGPAVIELVRFYVVQELIGAGIGSALMSACLALAQEMGWATIWLGVWEKNDRAIQFYQKWGFRKVGIKEFILGQDVQHDLIMQRSV